MSARTAEPARLLSPVGQPRATVAMLDWSLELVANLQKERLLVKDPVLRTTVTLFWQFPALPP